PRCNEDPSVAACERLALRHVEAKRRGSVPVRRPTPRGGEVVLDENSVSRDKSQLPGSGRSGNCVHREDVSGSNTVFFRGNHGNPGTESMTQSHRIGQISDKKT